LFLKVLRQQYRILRSALGLRQSAPINILLAESCEPPLESRFALLSSRYVYRSFARNSSLVVRSFRRLEIESTYSSRTKRIQLLRNVPIFRPYILQKSFLPTIQRLVTPYLFSYSFHSMFPSVRFFRFLGLLAPGEERRALNLYWRDSCQIQGIRCPLSW